ncbi:MAG: PIN domain-containing protein [Alphaproteobacteria bacterium]|nr:MAG: PIN domain-containing protein [Alphaproteobacteria bacterium]
MIAPGVLIEVPIRYAFDSCAFIALANNEDGRADAVRTAIEKARRGDHEILVSALIFAELLRPNVEAILNAPWVVVMSVDPEIGRLAAQLRTQFHMKVPDAIHLATAVRGRADALLTFDDDLLKRNGTPFRGVDICVRSPNELFGPGPLFQHD